MTTIIPGIEPWAEQLAAGLWRASWQGGIALALAWAIARWCTFLSPRVVCWVWRLACLKLLVALVWIEPVSLALLPARQADTVTLGSAEVRAPSTEASVDVPAVRTVAPAASQPVQIPPALGVWSLLTSAWLLGVVYCVVASAREWGSIRRLVRSAVDMPSERLQAWYRQEADRLRIRRLPQLTMSRHADGPLLAGVWRQVVVLPRRAEADFDEREVRLMLAHELAHFKRHDLAWNWLPTIISCLFFFHPLVWLMTRRWSEAQEAACDEMLIQRHVVRPADYGRLLVKVAAHWPCEPRSSLGVAGVLGAYRDLERRILAMAQVRPFSAVRVTVAATFVATLALPGIVPWRLVAREVDDRRDRNPTIEGLLAAVGERGTGETADDQKPDEQKDRKPDAGSDFLRAIRRASEPLLASMAHDDGYGLAEGQDVKRVAPPFPPIRMQYYRTAHPKQSSPKGPTSMAFRFVDGRLEPPMMVFSGDAGVSLLGVLDLIADLKPQMVEGPKRLLDTTIRGDWVCRAGAKPEQSVAALEAILQQELSLPIQLRFREVERPLFVARGRYRHMPLPGQPAKEKLYLTDETIEPEPIAIFGKELVPNSGSGGGTGKYPEFLAWLGRWIGSPIISEAETGPTSPLTWTLHGRSPSTESTRAEDHDADQVLKNITAQTGLTFKRETRSIRTLFVEDKK